MADEKQPIKVWHVEDGEVWQRVVSRALTKVGYQVHLTESAVEAKAMIPDRIEEFPVAILDGDLGDGTGEEIANLLREKQVPIGIIGLSSKKMTWADISLNKLDGSGDLEISKLLSAVARFLPAEPLG